MKKSIYVIKNKINGKCYVGQSVNVKRRFVQHLSRGNCKSDNFPIHLAINKYGKENFSLDLLEEDIENYNEREIYWIKHYNTLVPNGYNLQVGGGIENTILRGEKHPNAKIKDSVVEDIVEDLVNTSLTQREIAKKYNCSERVINSINSGERSSSSFYTFPLRKKFCHYSRDTLMSIKFLLKESECSYQSIADFYGLTKGTVAGINKGRSHKEEGQTYPLRKKEGKPNLKVEDFLDSSNLNKEGEKLENKRIN